MSNRAGMLPRPPALLALALLSACSLTRGPSVSGPVPANEGDYSVVLAGHVYSLYVPTKAERPDPAVGFRAPLQAFTREVERIDPRRVFLLGDNVRYGNEEEWSFLEDSLAPVRDRVELVAGNHEYRNIEAFRRHGGVVNESFVIGRNKFIVLDAKTWLEDEDLEFIRREVADHESYDNVFVLTHLFLAALATKGVEPSEIDPYGTYRGVSNWSRDVLPLIAGKVDVVFCGDTNERHCRNVVQEHPGGDVTYVLNGFRFGRGLEQRSSGDGPMLFVELRFSGSGYTIVPRAVPLDLRDTWYERFVRLPEYPRPETWPRHALGVTGIVVALPTEWDVEVSSEGLVASFVEGAPWKRLDFDVRPVGEPGLDPSALEELWKEGVLGDGLSFDRGGRTTLGGRPALWTSALGTVKGRRLYRWSGLVLVDGVGWAFTMTMPLLRVTEHVETLTIIRGEVEITAP
jgi:hypothetical protein